MHRTQTRDVITGTACDVGINKPADLEPPSPVTGMLSELLSVAVSLACYLFALD